MTDEPKFLSIYKDMGITFVHPEGKVTTGWGSLKYWSKTKPSIYNKYALESKGLLPVEYFQ